MYLLIKYMKSFLWRVAKRLSHVQDARWVKVKHAALQTAPPVWEIRNKKKEFCF